MAHEGLHEPARELSPGARDMHRAIISLIEELEAVDWYQQRIDAAIDEELRSILRHNQEEEQEHAAMLLEWMRRRDAGLDAKLRALLFREGAIREVAEEAAREVVEPAPPARAAARAGAPATIGALRRAR